MVGLIELLNSARDAGLIWQQDGDRLLVRGPRFAVDIAEQLIARKAEVFASITPPSPEFVSEVTYNPIPDWTIDAALAVVPITPQSPTLSACDSCQGRRWWRSIFGQHLICGNCHPDSTYVDDNWMRAW
jgi:hypothetical protein